jgi:hypothetical protein
LLGQLYLVTAIVVTAIALLASRLGRRQRDAT